MLKEHSLPTFFWSEAINTTWYVQNRVLISAHMEKTSYELCYGKQPKISYFKVFGYKCFILNMKDHLYKFDAKCPLSDKIYIANWALDLSMLIGTGIPESIHFQSWKDIFARDVDVFLDEIDQFYVHLSRNDSKMYENVFALQTKMNRS